MYELHKTSYVDLGSSSRYTNDQSSIPIIIGVIYATCTMGVVKIVKYIEDNCDSNIALFKNLRCHKLSLLICSLHFCIGFLYWFTASQMYCSPNVAIFSLENAIAKSFWLLKYTYNRKSNQEKNRRNYTKIKAKKIKSNNFTVKL